MSMGESEDKTVRFIDARGLRCPLPTLRVETELFSITSGAIIELVADCPTFDADVRALCKKRNLTLILMTTEGSAKRALIRV